MIIHKHELAKVLAELPDWMEEERKWTQLSHEQKLGYKIEADRVIKALKVLKEKHTYGVGV